MGKRIGKSFSFVLVFILLFSSFFTYADVGFTFQQESLFFVENFDNLGYSATTYASGEFVGNYGIQWSYSGGRGDLDQYPIDGKGIMFRRQGDNARIYAEAIPGGIGSFSVDVKKAFTSTTVRTIELLINDESKGTFTLQQYNPETYPIQTFIVNDINVEGNFKLEIKHISGGTSGSAQLVIDNITWTSFGGDIPTPTLSVNHTPVTTAIEGESIPISFTTNNVNGDVTGVLFYKHSNDDDYKTIITAGSAIIPSDEVFSGEIEYFIEVQDESTFVRSPESGTYKITVHPQVEIQAIGDIKGLPVGTDVIVEGIVTTKPGSFGGQGFYLQDITGGAYTFHSSSSYGVQRGNLVRIKGKTSVFNGGFQIAPIAGEILSSNTAEPGAKEIYLSEINLNNEGQLVTIKDVTITNITADNYKTAMVTVTDGINTGVVRLDNRTGFNSEQLQALIKIGDEVDVVGVVGFQNNEYRILIRDLEDVSVKGATKVAPVFAEPNGGAVEAGSAVSLTTATQEAAILYTTGEGDPDTVYTQPILINQATTIKAMAVKEGMENSDISSFIYTIREQGVLPILEVKKLPLNSTTEVRGVVTAVTGSSNREAYIQDHIAGLQINLPNIATKVKVGDQIKVTGRLEEFRGEIQFVPASLDKVIVESSNNPLPEALDVTIKQVAQAQGRLSVTQALTNYLGNERTITVRGVITNALPNGEFAMQIASQGDPTKVIDVALPAEYRTDFNPQNNPSVVGRMVLVTGQEKDYFNKPAIRRVDKYDTNTGITTRGKYHVGFDIEGMKVSTEAFEVISKDANGFTAKAGDVEVYIFTLRATNYNHVAINVGDWYSAKGIVAYYDRPQLKLLDGGDLKPETAPGQQDPREPLVLDSKPGNFVSTFNRSPLISARLEKTEADIDFSNVRLLVNGLKVDHILDEATGVISYQTENLAYGEHDVTIYVPDVQERLKVFSWFFRVEKENPIYQFYYGIPHAHTAYSDGAGTPTEAFEYAKRNNLDWLFITDHSNWLDGVTDNNYEYNPGANEYIEKAGSQWYLTRTEAEAINSKYNGEFLAVRGFEMTSSIWGHINTINSTTYVEAKKQMVPLREYYDWVADISTRPDANVFNAFNHPNWPDDSFNNLAYVPNLDRYFNGIEVANGAPPYSYSRAEGHYFKALDNGWRLGALNAQDNHAKNWGDPDSLTVVIAEQLDSNTLLDAMNARRMYSTETRTLELTVKGNGHWMGSVIDVAAGDSINLEILAQDSKVPIEKLQLITNGGHLLKEMVFTGGTNRAEWNLTVEAGGGAQWFVVKVIHTNGAWGHGSPIFTVAGENDVKLTGITVNPNPTLPGFNTMVEATVTNMGVRGIDGIEVKFYANSINEGNLIGAVTLDGKLNPGTSKTLSVVWVPEGHGEQRVFAVLTHIEGVTTVTEISTNVKVVKPIGKRILFDGAHNNADVPGTVVKIIEMLRLYGYEATINTQRYTAELLENVDVLIINTPLNIANGFTPAEEEAIAAWVNAGGSIMMASKSNYGQDSTILNTLMEKIGSTIRFNDDNVYEPENSDKYTGGMVWSIIMENLPTTISGLNSNMEAIRIFSGSSLINSKGGPLVNNPETELEILLYANKTSYNFAPGPKAYVYNLEGDLNGDTIPVIAMEKVGKGRIVAAGRHFYSDFEIGNNVSNTALTLQTIDWLAGYDRVRTIADIRENASIGDVVTVRGTVTAPTNHFFDVVYIQDGTSGVAVYGSQLKDNLPLGAEIIATGKVTYFEGELELAFENYDYEVIYVGMVDQIEAFRVSTQAAMASSVAGKLVTTVGVITDYNEIDGNFRITDGSGSAFIQIDGYLNLGMDRFTIGDTVSVTGIASHGSVGPRIRVRYYDDLELVEALSGPTVEIEGSVGKKESWNPNSTIPFNFSIKDSDGKADGINNVTVTIFNGDEAVVTYVEGKGANNLRQAGKSSEYMVNINTKALGLMEGEYRVFIEFNYNGQTRGHSVMIYLGKQ